MTFTNSTAITINDCPNPCPASGSAASLFPSPIVVSGVTGVVERVSVRLNGLSHGFPADTDFLLVSPSGRKVVIMSDFGAGSPGISNINVILDDYADRPIPSTVAGNTAWPFASGTYRPANSGTTDLFPAPAPAAPYAYCLSHFNGDSPNGTWNLYIIDDANLDGGSVSGGWSLTFDVRPPMPSAGAVVISEFRTRGVGTSPPGSDGSSDEFIELYNTTDQPIPIIDSIPGADPTGGTGAGWRIAVAQAGAEVAPLVIPQTVSTAGPLVLHPHGYFLISVQPSAPSPSGNTYSLASYPTGTGITASGSANISINPANPVTGFLPDDSGLALFSTATSDSARRMDSVGFSSVTLGDFKEGLGLAPPGGITTPSQHSWIRKRVDGVVQDSGDNGSDFQLVEVNGATLDGVAATLGAPGPQRGPTMTSFTTTSAPAHAPFSNTMTVSPVDGQAALNAAPNAVLDPAPVVNGTLGTLKLRAKVTNDSGFGLLAMRYRVIGISSLQGGSLPTGAADVRMLSNVAQVITLTDTSNVTLQALTLQQSPPTQPNGGGLNSSLGQGNITTTAPLANGATTNVEFTLGVNTFGTYEVAIIVEGLNTELEGVSGLYHARGKVSANAADLTVTYPFSLPDLAFTTAKRAITIDVLANDSVAPGELITIENPPTSGTATVVKGKVRYTPTVTLPLAGDTFFYRYNGKVVSVNIGNYANVAGSYDGLLTDASAPAGLLAHERAGRFQFNLTTSGTYTGGLFLGGKKRASLSGSLGVSGFNVLTIKRTPEVPITLNIIASAFSSQVFGSLQSTDFTGVPFGISYTLSRRTAAPGLVNSYTYFINPTGAPNTPSGTGYASAKVSASGDVTLTGKLADGVAFSTKTVLTPGLNFPIYLPLYANTAPRGSFYGTMQFVSLLQAFGNMVWFKPPRPAEAYFPGGFTQTHSSLLVVYQPPPALTPLLAFNPVVDNGSAVFSGGSVPPFFQFFTLTNANKVVPNATNPNKVAFSFNKTTGIFTGSFVNPTNNKKTTIQGAARQDTFSAHGFFRGAGPFDGGAVNLSKVP